MKTQTQIDISEREFKITVRHILLLFWAVYQNLYNVRDIVRKEVERSLQCHSEEKGVLVYMCKDCTKLVYQKLGCNSRLCSSCGKRYTDQWSKNLSKTMFKIPHRHIVISVPSALWHFVKEDRKRWKVYMDSAIETFNDYFPKIMKNRFIRVGIIVVLHPYGKDMKFQPHLHCIITEGGFDQKNNFIKKDFIPARQFAKCWQYHVLSNFQKAGLARGAASEMYKKYDGFYVWVHRAGRIENPKKVAKYVGRYVRHPSIADSRILSLDDRIVTFYYKQYKDGNEEINYVEMDVLDFISALIQHIPEKQFKMIRYYGAYARRSKKIFYKHATQSSIGSVQVSLNSVLGRKMIPKCPDCGGSLVFLRYETIPLPNDPYHWKVEKKDHVIWRILD